MTIPCILYHQKLSVVKCSGVEEMFISTSTEDPSFHPSHQSQVRHFLIQHLSISSIQFDSTLFIEPNIKTKECWLRGLYRHLRDTDSRLQSCIWCGHQVLLPHQDGTLDTNTVLDNVQTEPPPPD